MSNGYKNFWTDHELCQLKLIFQYLIENGTTIEAETLAVKIEEKSLSDFQETKVFSFF
jgi:hypothetical protein